MFNDLLQSKAFWIAVLVLLLVWIAYRLGYEDGKPYDSSPQAQREAIRECKRWGGKPAYDSHGDYADCLGVGP